MARILVVVPPLTGHTNPTIPLGRELLALGHEVAWAGLPGVVDVLLPEGLTFFPVGGQLGREHFEQLQERSVGLRGAAALKFLYEDFIIPLARDSMSELDALVAEWQPDLLVVDQQAVAGAVVARRQHRTWVTSATTSAELEDPLAALPKVDQWVRDQLVALQVEAGIDQVDASRGDLRFSDTLVLAFTTDALVDVTLPAANVALVGPSFGDRPPAPAFPWDWLQPSRPAVLVSLGTLNGDAGRRFYETVADALGGQPLQAIVVAPADLVPATAAAHDNLLFLDRVPQLDLLPYVQAVVSHGGHNTVCESLAHGLPLVVAPIRDDQPIIAAQVVRARAGVRVKFGRVRAADLREAVWQALDDPALRAGAQDVRASFEAAGGTPAAATAIEEALCLVDA